MSTLHIVTPGQRAILIRAAAHPRGLVVGALKRPTDTLVRIGYLFHGLDDDTGMHLPQISDNGRNYVRSIAEMLAAGGEIANAKLVVRRNPGPVVVIETRRERRASMRGAVPHQTTRSILEYFPSPIHVCGMCGAYAIAVMPPLMRALQPDDTNAACHPAFGGCGWGAIVPGVR